MASLREVFKHAFKQSRLFKKNDPTIHDVLDQISFVPFLKKLNEEFQQAGGLYVPVSELSMAFFEVIEGKDKPVKLKIELPFGTSGAIAGHELFHFSQYQAQRTQLSAEDRDDLRASVSTAFMKLLLEEADVRAKDAIALVEASVALQVYVDTPGAIDPVKDPCPLVCPEIAESLKGFLPTFDARLDACMLAFPKHQTLVLDLAEDIFYSVLQGADPDFDAELIQFFGDDTTEKRLTTDYTRGVDSTVNADALHKMALVHANISNLGYGETYLRHRALTPECIVAAAKKFTDELKIIAQEVSQKTPTCAGPKPT